MVAQLSRLPVPCLLFPSFPPTWRFSRALPLAFSYAGWIGGTILFLICGGLTNYTGKVLAKIMSKEPGLKTYADIGTYAFGPNARLVVSLLFCLELWAVSVGEYDEQQRDFFD